MVDGQQKQNFQRRMSNYCANNDNNKIADSTKLSDSAVATILLIFFCSTATSVENKGIFAERISDSHLTILKHGITSYSRDTLKQNTE